MSIYRREIETQCCNQWMQGIRTINGQYPDDNRNFDINAGDGIEVTPATGGINIAMKAPISGPMIYRGTVGTGGTVATLPDANVENSGWTYVAVTAGSTPDDTPKSYEIGDMIISNGQEWTVVPAGDDPVLWSDIQNKPTTVAGYGITDAVTLDGAQDITGLKTFKTPIGPFVQIYHPYPGATVDYADIDQYVNNILSNRIRMQRDGSTNASSIQLIPRNITGGYGGLPLSVNYDPGANQMYAMAPGRTYNSANINDIVTIGSLASNPNVVHTTGNEEMSGTLKVKSMKLDTVTGAAGQTYCVMDNDNPTIDRRARLVLGILANGNVELYLEKYVLSTGVRLAQQTILTL